MARKRVGSRLARRESKRLMRQSVLFFFLTIALVGAIIFWGIPAMVRLAGFLGDLRSSSQPIEDLDTIAPFAPQISVSYEATASARIDVNGYAEAGTTVTLFDDGNKVSEVVVNEEGEFAFLDIKLKKGSNNFVVQSVDAAGNESPLSKPRVVVFDNEDPLLEIESPNLNDEEIRSEEKLFNVSGKTDDDTVTVYIKDRLARVDSEGGFSGQVSLDEGDNEIKVRAVDVAGNETEVSFVVKYFE